MFQSSKPVRARSAVPVLVATAILLALVPQVVLGQTASRAGTASSSPDAIAQSSHEKDDGMAILQRMLKYYRSNEILSARVDYLTKVASTPEVNQIVRYQFTLKRPNLIALRALTDGVVSRVICDGRQIFAESPQLRHYSLNPAPMNFDEHLQRSGDLAPVVPIYQLILALMLPETSNEGFATASHVEHLDAQNVGATLCDRVKIDGELAGELWIAQGAAPWLLRFIPQPTWRNAAKAGEQDLDEQGWEDWVIEFRFKDVSREEPDGLSFRIDPPEGYSVGSLIELHKHPQGNPQIPARAEEPSSAIRPGAPAPDVTITTLEGKEVRLTDLKGKVVVLDFWATWCAPCVTALPELSELAELFRDKGLVLYGINVRESREMIQRFLENRELTAEFAVDFDGAVAKAFDQRALPYTLIIDQGGIIRYVHVGYRPDLQALLRIEARRLLEETSRPVEQTPAP